MPVYWHLPFRPAITFADENRTDLFQEIHAKSVIVDNRWTLFGSTNFDSITWAGGFREYSVWIDDPKIAAETTAMYDRLVNHPLLAVPHRVWLGKANPANETMAYFATLEQDLENLASCESSDEACDLQPTD